MKKKVMLAGDIHGSLQQVGYLYQKAIYNEVDVIFALGDFGYWEHQKAGIHFLDRTDWVAEETGIPMFWLDGNHENHEYLRRDYADKVTEDGFWEIRPNVFYSPRGHRFNWNGTEIMTLGGAWSIDGPDSPIFEPWQRRTSGKGWWKEEVLTDEEVAQAIADPSKVDIMLCHDLPTGIDMNDIMSFRRVPYTTFPASEDNRDKVRAVVDVVKPDFLYHGHYHVYYNRKLELADGHTVEVMGLGCDGYDEQSYTIIEV